MMEGAGAPLVSIADAVSKTADRAIGPDVRTRVEKDIHRLRSVAAIPKPNRAHIEVDWKQ